MPFAIYSTVQYRLKNYTLNTFFDVGANVGQSLTEVKNVFPSASVFCFEPVLVTYNLLVQNASKYSNVQCYNIALSNTVGAATINMNTKDATSVMNSMSNVTEHSKAEDITTETLDFFCNKNNIAQIDYLKIDTEGHDLQVLKGAENLLNTYSISFIQVEVSMNPTNKYHISFDEIKNYLYSFNYCIYGIYDQVQEWQTNTPLLRRANVVFISAAISS